MHVALLLLAAVAANGIILAALRKGMLTLPTKG
jgi:hypothetical protein